MLVRYLFFPIKSTRKPNSLSKEVILSIWLSYTSRNTSLPKSKGVNPDKLLIRLCCNDKSRKPGSPTIWGIDERPLLKQFY